MKKALLAIFVVAIFGLLFFVVAKKSRRSDFIGRISNRSSSQETDRVTDFELDSGDYDFSLMHNGLQRSYKLHIPPGYNKNTKMSMVVYLHGGGGNPEAAQKDGLYAQSDKSGFLLLAPGGTGGLGGRFLTWNAGKWEGGSCCGSAAEKNIDDVGFVSSLIDEVETKVNVDSKKIYATGISNGAMMSYRLACELTSKIAAVAAVAPPAVPDECYPSLPIAVMQIHGTSDPCAPFSGGKGGGCLSKTLGFDPEKDTFTAQSFSQMVDWWKEINACSSSSSADYVKGKAICQSYKQCSGEAEVEFCKVEGMGHVWPSGHQYLPARLIGSVSSDISNDQIWDFFQRHHLP